MVSHDELKLCVSFRPELSRKLVQILGALSVGEGELKEAVFGLWAQDNELGQARDVHVLAHE